MVDIVGADLLPEEFLEQVVLLEVVAVVVLGVVGEVRGDSGSGYLVHPNSNWLYRALADRLGRGEASRTTRSSRALYQSSMRRMKDGYYEVYLVPSRMSDMMVESIKERVEAGATLVQIYTAFIYEGPWLPKRLATGLSPNPTDPPPP